MKAAVIERNYRAARTVFEARGVDTDRALQALERIPVSLHCWQGDDVAGFESGGTLADSGLMATGNYPGRARNPDELRADLDQALDLLPGRHRVNLHAIYAETGGRHVDRDGLDFSHFREWAAWARDRGLGLDFNPTFFAHAKAASGLTLTHPDRAIRAFWVEHGRACRRIGERMGRFLKTPCVTNIWIPDGSKDSPADRRGPRERLTESLDAILETQADPRYLLDSVESKLFGIGSESYVAGSHEFYTAYAVRRQALLCLDTGHFHPTETISDKISALLGFLPGLLLHVSRGIRWDSDHVVTLTEDLLAIAHELVRGRYLNRVHIGLDYFDASINRVAAWVIGVRAMLKALLVALLEPVEALQAMERSGDLTGRLALMEESKMQPFHAVWDHYCLRQGVPTGDAWVGEVRKYEQVVLRRRG